MNARNVLRALQAEGWIEARSKGSHRQFRHPMKPGLATVPVHGGKDLSPALLRSIERQTGLVLRRK